MTLTIDIHVTKAKVLFNQLDTILGLNWAHRGLLQTYLKENFGGEYRYDVWAGICYFTFDSIENKTKFQLMFG